ncbi:MAG: TonB-dependent receptor [Candidatus Acidiferrum sp.]
MLRRERFWKLRVLLGALALLLASGEAVYGQSQAFTATLNGTVIDPSSMAVEAAKVTLRSPELGVSRTTSTGTTGLYTFTFLPPGVYVLEVEAKGFKQYKQDGITLIAGQNAELNITVVVGAASETVEVSSQAPLLNAENANISSDISAKQAQDLPLNFRSVISLSMLNSSVSNTAEEQVVGAPGLAQTADQDISFLNFGGTFFDTAEYLLDGTWDTRADWGGVIYVPSVDSVAEFKIQTNAFTAQYGWSSGNVINIVTKSGSNEFHGDAYEFYANSSLDARYFFNNGAQPAFHRSQYGGTVGGPIIKNKLYYFAYYEGLRQASPDTSVFTVPTADERTGNFSALLGGPTGQVDAEGRPILSGAIYNPFSTRQITGGTIDPVTGLLVSGLPAGQTGYIRDALPGNMIPANLMDTIASKIAAGNYWPTPTNSNLVSNFTATAAAPEHSDEYSGRLDYNLSDNDRFNVRWSQKYQTKTNTPTFFGASNDAGPGLTNPNNRYSVDLGYNHIFSSTLAMNLNFGVNRHVEAGQTQGFGFQSSSLGLPSFINSIAPDFPQITEQGYTGLGASGGNNDYITPQTLWTQSVDFTKVSGKHTFAFGFMNVWLRTDGGHYGTTDLSFQTTSTEGPDPLNPAAATGNGFASFLLGVGSGTDNTNFAAFPATDKNFLGWYLQDGWKVSRRVTVNLGLRYEIQTAPRERENQQNYFNFTAENPISGQVGVGAFIPGELVFNSPNNRGLYNTTYTNVAPRIGIAYQARDKIVLRAGYGIFYVPNYYGQGPNTGYSQTTPWVTSLDEGLTPSSTLSGNASLGLPSAFPNGPLAAMGSALGGLTDVGYGVSITDPVRSSPLVQQWMAGVQYSFTPNDLLDISYIGNDGKHVLANTIDWDEFPAADLSMGNALLAQVPNPFYGHITSSGCGLNNPTVVAGQLLLPFPEYCSVNEAQPAIGSSNYNALQATYTHRWHSGLDLNVSYTYSKFLDNVQGNSGWAFPGSGNSIRNSYDLSAEKSVDVSDIPNSLVIFYNYELPFGKGKQFGGDWSGPVNAVLGGWQWSGILTAKSGLPLSINPATNNTGGFGFNQRPNIVAGVSPIPQNQSINDWVNAAAFAQPAPYTFGDAPRFLSNLRAPRYFDFDTSVQKRWNITEHKQFQLRFEMFNAFNHPDFFEPDTNLGDGPNFGRITAAYQARTVQFAGKFYW